MGRKPKSTFGSRRRGRSSQPALARGDVKARQQHARCAKLFAMAGGFYTQGNFSDALQLYNEILKQFPQNAEAHNNLAAVWKAQGQWERAVSSYREAIRLRPGFADAHFNLGNVLRDLGHLERAVTSYREAIRLRPGSADAHFNLGNVLRDLGHLERAVTSYREAIRLRPDHTGGHVNLGNVLKQLGRVRELETVYKRALRSRPDQTLLRLRLSTLCPPVFQSQGEIEQFRNKLQSDWRRIAEENLRVSSPADLLHAGCIPPFHLQYQGQDDRPLKELFAGVFRNCFAAERPPDQASLPRIGFVVTGGHEGIFLRFMRGVLEHMHLEGFELVIVCSQGGSVRIREAIRKGSIQILTLPERLDQVVDAIRAARFALLYYWEVGSDTLNYFLPFFRLAPVQCTSWGVPVTAGLSQIDYYLSSELSETPGAELYYTEKLIKLAALPTFYERPPLDVIPETRQVNGLTGCRHRYVCPQNPSKLHPDFDELAAEILRQDPRGDLMLLSGQQPHIMQMLQQRFQHTMPDCLDRIHFVPRQNRKEFLNLLRSADVLLDPLHCGGGNTTYEGLAVGTPIVTLPSGMMRGRITYACYQKLSVMDCVAADFGNYVELAVRLATERDFRQAVHTKIVQANDGLFEDRTAIRELEEFFAGAIKRATAFRTDS